MADDTTLEEAAKLADAIEDRVQAAYRAETARQAACRAGPDGKAALAAKDAEIARLRAIIDAQVNIIWWYEDQIDRYQAPDDEVPADLREAEEALEAAQGEREGALAFARKLMEY